MLHIPQKTKPDTRKRSLLVGCLHVYPADLGLFGRLLSIIDLEGLERMKWVSKRSQMGLPNSTKRYPL